MQYIQPLAFTFLHYSLIFFTLTQLFSAVNEDNTENTFPRPILETLLNLQCGHLVGIDRYFRYTLVSLLRPRLFSGREGTTEQIYPKVHRYAGYTRCND
jgi:hypothetical protein